MDRIQRIIDLKAEEIFVGEYVSLRNRYHELLLTKPVNVAETKEWLRDDQIEIRGLVKDNVLLGVVILYLNRDGEIAFIATARHQGIGTELLKIIEQVAKEKKLKSLWAWVLSDNMAAKRAFEKNGYRMEGESPRFYEGKRRTGIQVRKEIP